MRKIHQSWFLVWLAIGIIAGTILGLIFRINFLASPVFLILSGFLFIICLIRPLLLFSILALLSGFLLSFVRIANELTGENYIHELYDTNILVTGSIDGDPETDENSTKFKLANLKFGENKVPSAGSLYVSLTKSPNLARDDLLTLSGKLSKGFGTYSGYLYHPRVVWWARPDPGNLAVTIRNWFSNRIESLIPDPEIKLGLSYLLGMKSNLPDELSENLRTVGLTHIIVTSGAHLAILVEIAKKLFGKVSRFTGLFFSILFILFFMAMVGWTPSILRAGIMNILNLISWYVGRRLAPWRIILITAATTLLINPNFIFSLGWLLSFAAFFGIMVLGPSITRFFYDKRNPGFIASIILTTLSATIMTLPLTLYYYGQLSLVSVFANLLILPTLSYTMGLIFLVGVFSGLPGIETILAFLATKLLDFHIFIVNLFGQWTEFLVKIPSGKPQVFLLYFPILTLLSIGLIKRKVIKLKQVNKIRSISCQDTVNGRQPNGKKP